MTIIDNYLCNVTVGSNQYTVTRNQSILDYVGVINSSTTSLFDFRSKSNIDIDTNSINAVPIDCSIDNNPFLSDKNNNLEFSKALAARYLTLPSDIFTNTIAKPNCTNTASFIDILLHNPGIVEQYIDDITLHVCLQDHGAIERLISDCFEDIEKIYCIPHLSLIELTINDLHYKSYTEINEHVREQWSKRLKMERSELTAKKYDLLNTFAKQQEECDTTERVELYFTVAEIKKEVRSYNDIDLDKEVRSIMSLRDVFRYYPFNETPGVSIQPVNIWHYKAYKICRSILPNKFITFYDVETNNSGLIEEVYSIKNAAIQRVKDNTIRMLENEIATLGTDDLPENKSLIQEITDIKKLIVNAATEIPRVNITETINYWPAILNPVPEEFVL